MANPFLQNLRILVGKLESPSTPGTPVSLADEDYNVRIRLPENALELPVDDEAQKYATGDHGEDESIPGAQSAVASFHCKCAWGGDVTTEPAWWKFAHCCGAVTKAYSTYGIALQPLKSGDLQTMTIGIFDILMGASPTAVLSTYAGCTGTWTLGAEGIGMPWINNFAMTGKLVSIADVSNPNILALTSPDTTLADRFLNNPFTIGAVAQRASSFQLDTGNQINPLINQADSTGYQAFGITARQPRFSCDPLLQTVAVEDILAIQQGATPKAISLNTGQTVPHFTLDIPTAQLLSPALANREGYVNWDQTWKCLRYGTDDATYSAESTWELLIGKRAA